MNIRRILLALVLALSMQTAVAAITQTGSIVTHLSGANGGSTSITVPADAVAVEIHAHAFTGAADLEMTSMTLGGAAITLRQNFVSNGSTYAGVLGTLVNPATGSQTFAWNWSGAATNVGGGVFIFRFLTGVDTADPVRDSDSAFLGTSSQSGSITLDSAASDFVSGSVISYSDAAVGAPGGSGQTVDANDLATVEPLETVDLFHEDSPGASSTTLSVTGGYPVVMGISWKAAAGSPATLSSATPSGTLGTATTATLGATTDVSAGTFYGVVDTAGNISGITATQIKAGQNNASAAAVAASNSSVSSTSPSTSVTGLTASTSYSYAVVQNTVDGDSNVLTGTFTTAAASGTAVPVFLHHYNQQTVR